MGSNPATAASVALAPFTFGTSLLLTPTVYQAEEGAKARKEAGKQADLQRQQFEKLTGDLANQNAAQTSTAAQDAARRSARKRQLALSTAGTSRQDTILTQGLGSTYGAAPVAKTLLGA